MLNKKYIFKNLTKIIGFVAIAILFAVVGLRGHTNITDEDTWFHLKAGEYIVQNGIPTTEVFSHSIRGQYWNNHEWLWQVLLNALRQTFDDGNIVFLQALITTTIFMVLMLMGYRRGQTLLFIVLLFLVLIAQKNQALMRPDIASLWFTVIFICLLYRFLKKPWAIIILFVLQVLWANIHGFFILGPLLALVLLAAESIKRSIPLPFDWNVSGQLNSVEYRRLIMASIVLVLACLINPQFVKGFWYPMKVMIDAPGEAKYFYSLIWELRRPLGFYNLMNVHVYPVFKLLIVLSTMGFIANYRKIDIRAFFLWIAFLGFALAANRNVIFFEIAACMSLAVNLSQIQIDKYFATPKIPSGLKYTVIIALQLWVILWIGQDGQKMLNSKYFDVSELKYKSSYGQVSDQKFPKKAATFLAKNKVKGNFFNSRGIGQYLIATQYPNIRIFIDGRTEVYGAEFYKTYEKIVTGHDWNLFQKQIDQFDITGIILDTLRKPVSDDFLKSIYRNPQWKLVYFDYDALVFLKNIPQNRALIDYFKKDLIRRRTKPADGRFLSNAVLADTYYKRAVTLKGLDFDRQAEIELNEALKVLPHYVEAMILKAQIYRDSGKFAEAIDLFGQAMAYNPKSITIMKEAAIVYELTDNFTQAEAIVEKMISQAPKDPRGHYLRSKLLAKRGQFGESFEVLEKAYGLRSDMTDVRSVVDILRDQKADFWVQKVYDLVSVSEGVLYE